jgi:alginate O-acetyltransferase complex protein AlgI
VSFVTQAFFLFLPIVLLGYHALPTRWARYRFLLVASWVFYMWWQPWLITVILFTTLVDYTVALRIERAATQPARRAWLWLSIATNLGFLGFFKYSDALLQGGLWVARAGGWSAPDWTLHILLPLGISFHTFQGMGYTIDVYRGRIAAVRSLPDFALFIAFFPQLVAGPIVRAGEFLPQMVVPPTVTVRQIEEGLHFLILGFFKKAFLADGLAPFVDTVFAHPELYDGATHRWAVIAYMAQVYCDFAGYSDIAVGCAKWLGFELPLNFRFPFAALSPADFWRRWHITLSMWLRDYVYLPLGGNRGGMARTSLNLLVTMTLCGIWHGPSWNYVLWGFYNGMLLVAHRIYDRVLRRVAWGDRLRGSAVYAPVALAATFALVALGFAIVRSHTWAGWLLVEQSLLGGAGAVGAQRWIPASIPILLSLVAAGHAFGELGVRRVRMLELAPPLRAGIYATALVVLVLYGTWSQPTFIYFQF